MLIMIVMPSPAYAADGVLEINQACAVNGGCFDGDTAGFPVTISQPGSYRLTGNLTLSSADDTGILLAANDGDVTVDLNGFSIRGVTVCTGVPVTSCEPVAQPLVNLGIGIGRSLGPGHANVTVKNGTIRGMGGIAVSLGVNARVIGVRAISNAGGIGVLGNSVVRDCTAFGNGNSGINAVGLPDPDNLLTIIQGNVSAGNEKWGIRVHNTNALVTGNTASNNGAAGITATAGSGYSNNVVLGNVGTIDGFGVAMGDNLCNGSTTCP
jgi:hypothetical protein